MDLMYSKYTSPMDFMHLYIEQGRFGEFVTEILELERKRKEEVAQKEDEQKMWELYLHSMQNKSFNDWKKEMLSNQEQRQQPQTLAMSGEQVEATKQKARGILKNFSPV